MGLRISYSHDSLRDIPKRVCKKKKPKCRIILLIFQPSHDQEKWQHTLLMPNALSTTIIVPNNMVHLDGFMDSQSCLSCGDKIYDVFVNHT